MKEPTIAERLQQALVRLKNAAEAVVWCDPDLIDERLLDDLADAATAADEVLAGKPVPGEPG